VTVQAYQNVFYGREVREETNILIGSCNSQTDNSVRKQTNQGVVVEEDLSGFRPVKSGHAVKEGCLASSVGSDDAMDTLLPDF
jgi:hypothetical protein